MKELTQKQRKHLLIGICAVGIPLLLLVSLLWGNPQEAPAALLRISEVMNHNRSVYADDDGKYHDWVEIQNTGDYAISLDGFSITDDPEQPDKYVFENVVLKSGECVAVHLTGKKSESRFLYAPFGLDSSGDTVYLCDGETVLDRLTVGESPENVSYGRYGTDDVWFAVPTPGAPNDGICAKTADELKNACYTGVMISEVCAVSASTDTDWVELRNTTDKAISLDGYRLTEAPEDEGYRFENVTVEPGGYYTLACDSNPPSDITPCAPFSLDRFGDTLYLYTPNGVLCDAFETGKQRSGVTSGRAGDDRTKRVYFDTPTKNAANGTAYVGYAPAPAIQQTGGYVEAGTTVTVTVPNGCVVYYTLNGSVPTTASPAYVAGQTVAITENAVLRAVAYRKGYLPSDVVTQTFLTTDQHDLPIVSVSGDYDALFGPNGTFTRYNNETLTASVHMEYFAKDGTKEIAFDSILKIAGGMSRVNPQKAFSLKLNQTVGVSSVTYPFFEDSAVSVFSDLLLRPSGSDWDKAKLRDEFAATALKNTEDLVIQSARPVALYINGDYHGLYYLREKRNEAFIASYTGIPEEYVQLAEMPAVFESTAAMDPDMAELIDYAKTHDLTEKEHYEHVLSKINETSLIRYFAIQSYLGNGDMINNIACYRDTRGGEWNWIIFDMDWACTSFYSNHEFIKQLYNGTGQNTFQNYYYPLITALFKNEDFSAQFLSEYKRLMDTTLSADRLVPILDELADAIRSEIPRQLAEFGAPSTARFEQQVNYMRNFLKNRKTVMERQLKGVFDLTDEDWESIE
ncbi:MAG: CotH kinase family protein [Clostridia bacterium]|nr:CotH kinase family protein [Clostridia bacterium]